MTELQRQFEEERLVALSLLEFTKTLQENLAYPWELRHGRPPKSGYVEQKEYSTSPWTAGEAFRAWTVAPDSVCELLHDFDPPSDRAVDGMFFDTLVGFFGISQDRTNVSINWQTGPRFGRGFVHPVERRDGALWLGPASSTWIS